MSLWILVSLAMTVAPAPKVMVIERPDWIEKPSGDDVNLYFPSRARDEGVGGKVKLRCKVLATGYVTQCEVLEEDPKGYEFGAASISLSSKFRMKPLTVDGQPVDGALVVIPLSFAAPEDTEMVEGMPDLDVSLTCYGYNAALAELEPGNADARASATIFMIPIALGAHQAGWSPSKTEAALTKARKGADPTKKPKECPTIPNASKQLPSQF